ncbi:hypothetical protein RJ55_02857 [Drechmeria coniospora]|nr:hypothetical protein RJ55_02857 [Drechmeria coniospora]
MEGKSPQTRTDADFRSRMNANNVLQTSIPKVVYVVQMLLEGGGKVTADPSIDAIAIPIFIDGIPLVVQSEQQAIGCSIHVIQKLKKLGNVRVGKVGRLLNLKAAAFIDVVREFVDNIFNNLSMNLDGR